ncbi:general substrate transporter [Neolentinus lepideus HHB14362 ss-1]|uniref:General substrate transporter n=1 Tax=Neolentinus lepideus HHB14362 ss-1 TaxID=1314782 RepID=A0A165UDZ4_9AGAM|nr:general substrate transporter [Neolentinus lepideus HHB14362 ss-1]
MSTPSSILQDSEKQGRRSLDVCVEDITDKSASDFEADVAARVPKLRGRKLRAALAFIAGTGFTLFGYDQGVMSGLLTGNQFEATFPQVVVDSAHPNHATLQSFIVAIYEIGCLVGALSNLWIGDRLGRRRTIFWGGIVMTVGAVLQTTSYSYAQMIVARIVTGIGNGLITSTVPSYHAECSHASNRGSFIMFEGTMITLGLTLSYVSDRMAMSYTGLTLILPKWIDFACYFATGSPLQWRLPIALQIILEFILAGGIMYLPESPRWLVKRGYNAEAIGVLSAIDDTDPLDPEVRKTFIAIREAVAMEGDVNKGSLKELFTGGKSQNFRRAATGVVCQAVQQLTGINLVSYYATILFQRLGMNEVDSRIVAACNGTEYFLASFLAIYFIDRAGRRKLMLIGTAGCCLTMTLLAILGAIDTPAAQIVSAVLLFGFNTFFALGWLGMGWLYPAEIVGIGIRAPANALSTASNWTFNFLVVMIVGPAFNSISWGTYLVFAALNFITLPIVYFFFPETAGRSLEDMDIIYAVAYNEGVSPVKVSFRKDLPEAGSPEADEILGLSAMRMRSAASNSQEQE